MPSYNLTNDEVRLLTTWLFEPSGYLDFAVRSSDGQTAREAWLADPTLDVAQWVRDHPQLNPGVSDECAMVWWIRANDQVNVTPPTRPPEAATWAARLHEWDTSIETAFGRVGQAQRDADSAVPMYGEDGNQLPPPNDEMRAGTHLLRQQQIITKALSVLE